MIIDAIVKVVTALLTGILGLVPAYTLNGSFTSAGAGLGSALGAINGVFPVGTLGACLGVVLSARLFMLAWNLIVFIYDKFPAKAT